MDVQQLCRTLKPIIGAKADQYWLAYLAEDYRGKQEIETVLNLLAARLLGSDVENPEVHLSAPPEKIVAGDYPLGHVEYAGNLLYPFGMREDEIIQHTAIFGRSGAGKTNTVFHVIQDFLDHKKPFVIFDWKRNYRDLLAVTDQEILVYTVGRDTAPFVFNPLIPPEGTDAAVWLKKLIEIIATSYYLGEGVMFLLQEAIHAVYKEKGVYSARPKQYPTFNDVLTWLHEHPVKGRQALWMDSTMRGVKSMCFGHMGEVVNTGVQPNVGGLLSKNVILELDGLTNADKALITQSLLLWIHHYRLAQPDRETFKHAIIIEEAHHILAKQTGRGGEVITETILREIRELGEAITLIDQHPSLISLPALGNTYTTLTMNLKHSADVSAIAAAMLLQDEEKEVLGRLPVGSAVVKLQGRWPRAFRVRVPHTPIPKGTISDTMLREKMQPYRLAPTVVEQPTEANPIDSIATSVPSESPTEPQPGLADNHKALLFDVAQQPLSGIVERYRRLGISRRKGNTVKEQCVQLGLVSTIEIPTRSGRVVLLELTEEGKRTLRRHDYEVPDRSRWGSLEHEYWKTKVAEHLQRLGWTASMEEPVNGFTDIIARREGRIVACEIETGRSDWRANVVKNVKKGHAPIVLIATNEDAHREIAVCAPKEFQGVDLKVIQAQEVVEKNQDLI
ncbi:MAG: ATP-binding protein [Candidatus Hydrogenedentes bacterium]|nr:ATP-binding protein [Candidatus Hydrogenedentota bacterium]